MPKRLTSEQKKKRLLQLRDAQRRRRSRLKVESRHFVQIILSSQTLENLRHLAAQSNETVQHLVSRLIEQQVGGNAVPVEEDAVAVGIAVGPVSPNGSFGHHLEPEPQIAESVVPPPPEVPDPDQLDLFG